jgi:hypothetical protein
MSLQSFVRFLLPREDHFYDFIEKQAAVAHEAALALAEIKKSGVKASRRTSSSRGSSRCPRAASRPPSCSGCSGS